MAHRAVLTHGRAPRPRTSLSPSTFPSHWKVAWTPTFGGPLGFSLVSLMNNAALMAQCLRYWPVGWLVLGPHIGTHSKNYSTPVDIRGNEEADRLSKAGSKKTQFRHPISYPEVKHPFNTSFDKNGVINITSPGRTQASWTWRDGSKQSSFDYEPTVPYASPQNFTIHGMSLWHRNRRPRAHTTRMSYIHHRENTLLANTNEL